MKTIYKKLLFLFLLLPICVLAQNTFSGTVLDKQSGQAIPGVNVNVQGSTMGASTDFDGKFLLGNVKKGDKIVFSFIGYKSETVEFNNQQSITVTLGEDANQLQEVIVQVGYGSVKKKDATGSVALITTKDFNKGATVTAENLLSGRIAGVTINTSGAPGSSSEIRIRGGSSLFASNDPLIVIDGLPIESNSDKNFGSTSILASINPSTIESISVLKDASATAIYGSRASNGVIIITTKKGGKILAVDYNVQYGSGKVVKAVNVFGADEFKQVIADHYPAGVSRLGTSNTDWQKAIYRRTDFVDNNLSIRGNLLGVIPTRLTVGNTYQEGLRLTNTFNRNTVGLAMNPSFFDDHLKLKLNANYANELNRFTDGVEGSAINFDPTQPIYDAGSIYGGFFEYYNHSNGQLTTQTPRNPVAQLLQTNDSGKNNRYYGNFELDYKFHFFPNLRAIVNVGFDEAKGQRSKNVGANAATAAQNNNIPYGTEEFSSSTRRNKLFESQLVYNRTFDKLVFEIMGGYSYQKYQSNSFLTGNVLDVNLVGFPQYKIDTDRITIGYFGRTNLNYDDKYLLTLSLRDDNSSKFSKKNRSGIFPAVAFAWKMKEDFFKNNNTLSELKLRLGWGITGQQDIPPANAYLQKYYLGDGNSQYTFGTTNIPIAISDVLSPDLKWELTSTYNVGLDYGILNNRISGAVDVFYKDSRDMLANVAVADGGNFSNVAWQNVGSFTTKGIELALNLEVVKSTDFNWNVNLNATKFERRVSKLNVDNIRVGDNLAGTGTQGQVLSVGYTPYSYKVYKQLYTAQGQAIEGAFADLNGDGIINDSDKYIYKNPDPDVTFGFASNLNYKNLDFSFNLRASVGNRVLNAVNAKNAYYALLNTGNANGNIPSSVTNTGFITSTDKVVLSDINVENASYLKMDNISLGYTFPKWLEGKASLRLFTGCQNVFTITKYSGLDPEIANNGVDNTIYPRQRSFLFGANVKF